MSDNRRQFLKATALTVGTGAVTVLIGSGDAGDDPKKKKGQKGRPGAQHPEEDVGATEDLMREHGILNRVLLIYEEGLRRLHDNRDIGPEVFHTTANLVRRFVEDYHERLEENFIFPEFERRRQHTELVRVLRQQHQAGRRVTDIILRHATADGFRRPEGRRELVRACEQFIRMYRPHEAREDTVLFPALHGLLTPRQFHELGERFEHEEDRLFGEGGFERTVEQVATIERQLHIYDLAQFTPRLGANER